MRNILPYILLILLIAIGCTRSVVEAEGEALLEEAEKAYLVGNYIESMKSVHTYIKKVENGELRSTPELETKAYKFLGNIHLIYGDRLTASTHYHTAIKAAENLEDKEEKLKLIYNLVIVYQEIGRQAQVDKLISEIKNAKGVHEGLRKYFYYCACAIRDQSMTESDRSFRWMEKALRTVDDYRLEPYLKYNPYRFICQAHLSNNDYEKALPMLKQYEAVIKSTGEGPESELECAQALAHTYTMLGENEKSMKYQSRVEHLSDSLDSQQQFLKAKREYEASVAEDSGSAPWIGIIIAVSILTVIAVAVLIFMRRSRRNKVAEATIPAATAATTEEKPSGVHDELFSRISEMMEQDRLYTRPDISVELLSNMLGTNVKYVSQAVSSHTGCNFRSYVNGLRIREACRMLSSADADTSVQGVAKATGFVSQSVFISAFRRETGLTPSAYLKKAMETKAEILNESE